jgi:hypothetical protein
MSLESVLHKIVNRLPIAPHEKDELLSDVTAEVGEKQEESSAPE